jgi:hypothetical protein
VRRDWRQEAAGDHTEWPEVKTVVDKPSRARVYKKRETRTDPLPGPLRSSAGGSQGTRSIHDDHAVLIEVDVTTVAREAGLEGLRELIVPAIRGMPGFRAGVWLTGNEAGKGLSLTLWDDQQAAQAMAERFGAGVNPLAGTTVVRCEFARWRRSPASRPVR